MTRHGRHASRFRALNALVGQSCRDTSTPPMWRDIEASNASALRLSGTDCDSPHSDYFTGYGSLSDPQALTSLAEKRFVVAPRTDEIRHHVDVLRRRKVIQLHQI